VRAPTAASVSPPEKKESIMLWTIAVVLVALWVLGLATSYTIGGLIHLLLVLAVVSVVFQLFRGRARAA
jgi:hypothetical protein